MLEDLFTECAGLGIPVSREGFEDYLHDESRFTGFASGLVRVREESQVVHLIRLANKWNVPLTVVAGKTSLTGASVPLGGIIVDIRGLDSLDPADPGRAGPGVLVRHYREYVESKGFFYPPDPTSEESCTLGGNVACNASGALAYLYGPTRRYIEGLRVVFPPGGVIDINRGDVVSSEDRFLVPRDRMVPRGAEDLVIPVPRLQTPQWPACKNTAGLYSSEPMDLVDLFIGSEGILGVVLEIRTVLLPRRNPFFALMLYIPTRELTVDVVRLLDDLKRLLYYKDSTMEPGIRARLEKFRGQTNTISPQRFRGLAPACMEWIGASTAAFVSSSGCRQRLRESYGRLYIEQEHAPNEDPLDVASRWADLVDLVNGARQGQCPEMYAEVAFDQEHIRKMRKDRESVPERLNESIRPGMVKVGADFALPMNHLGELLKLYEESLKGMTWYSFGHIGNCHLHVNMLPQDDDELRQCREIYRQLARAVCSLGGTVSAEHGIGKLKRDLLEIMIGAEGVEEIRRIKRALDPYSILNRGNIVSLETADEGISLRK